MAKLNEQADEEIAPGTIVDGRYKVVRSIGQGGNGLVYEVEHTRTGRRLALKALLDEAGFGRLEQEARAASLMKNGHTARIIDMEPTSSLGPYMVMELLEGQSLRALLDEAGQLPLELTVNMVMQACECLFEAHGLGIIHRDLKPENIFLCASPWPGQYDVKVLDFGVMKVAADGGAIPKSSLTRTGSTVGTPYYMSLEQLRNSSQVDARADVYSLGVVLYECLSGRKPFQAETIGDLVYALCSGPPTPLTRLRPDLPTDVSDVVMRTLSANRDDRPATMRDLAGPRSRSG
jgi:eukaryotic-like serine/threonine-protein kinase